MIEEIHIRDLGIITDARLPLEPGFSVLTGETGAGKTMVVTPSACSWVPDPPHPACATAPRAPLPKQ